MMGTKLNRHCMQELVDDDIAWLKSQPQSLERGHVIAIVEYFMANYNDGSKPSHVWNETHNPRKEPNSGKKLLLIDADGHATVGHFYGGVYAPESDVPVTGLNPVKWAYLDYLQLCQVTQKSEFDQWRLPTEEPDDGDLIVIRDDNNQIVGFFDCCGRTVHPVSGPNIHVNWGDVKSWAYLHVNHERIHV